MIAFLLALFVVPGAEEKSFVVPGSKLEKLWGEGEFTEGPTEGPDGCVYFSDIGNRVMKFDPKTEKMTTYPVPKEWQSNSTQESMVFPNYSNVDGYVWTNNQETHVIYRVNVKTGQYEAAAERFRAVLDREPSDAMATSLLGRALKDESGALARLAAEAIDWSSSSANSRGGIRSVDGPVLGAWSEASDLPAASAASN